MSEDLRLAAAEQYEAARERRFQGNDAGALRRYERCLALIAQLGDSRWQAQIEAEVGEMYQEQYRLPEATEWLERARARWLELGDRRGVAEVDLRLGQVRLLEGDAAAAVERLREAQAAFEALGDGEAAARAGAECGRAQWEGGEVAEGIAAMIGALGELSEEARSRVLDQLRYRGERLDREAFRRHVQAATADEAVRRSLLA